MASYTGNLTDPAYEFVFTMLRGAGWNEDDLWPVVRSLEYLAIGSAMRYATDTPEQSKHFFEFGVDALINGLRLQLTTR